MSRTLPAHPDLDHLKKQVKDRLRELQTDDPSAKLADALHALANEYGFASWIALKDEVEARAEAADPFLALVSAVRTNSAARVAELLARHPEVKQRLNDPMPIDFGSTLMMGAVTRKNLEMVDALLAAGADIDARSDWWAGSFGVLDNESGLAPQLIKRGAFVDAYAAARLGMIDRLKEIVSADPSAVNMRGGDGQTPLHVASTVEIADFLLDRGADIDAKDIDHESTPAQYLVAAHPEIVRRLIARGCKTDLLMAAAIGDLDLARRHLDANPACINMSVSDEWFPRQNPKAASTIYVWAFGWNKTAHSIARAFGHEDVVALLMSRTDDATKLALACEQGDEKGVDAILGAHPNLTAALSPAHRRRIVSAAMDNNTNAVRLMLRAGWPSSSTEQRGATALHWASFHGNLGMAQEILRHDPPLEAKDAGYQSTPMGWAIHGSLHGWHRDKGDYAGVVKALLDAGATPPAITPDFEASEPVRAVLRKPT